MTVTPENLLVLDSPAAAVGRSVLQEIRRVRLETAKELLKSGNTDIAAISSRCGYKSISAFSMFFRVETGQSPSSWRDSNCT